MTTWDSSEYILSAKKCYHNGLVGFIGIFSNDFIKRVEFPETLGLKRVEFFLQLVTACHFEINN